jgi:predicted homoserine dehydrogenase-like protein
MDGRNGRFRRFLVIYHHLYDKSPKPLVRAGLIGSGHFGITVIAQAGRLPRLDVRALADTDSRALEKALGEAEIPRGDYVFCDSPSEAAAAFEAGKIVCTLKPLLLVDLPLDVVVEATGNPEAGALHALRALEKGRHVAMVNKEADSCVGPFLRKIAEERGLVYSPVDGDQHGALMQMVEWARDNGLEVISAGKSRDAEFVYDPAEGTVTVYSDGGITIPETRRVRLNEEDKRYFESLPDDRIGEFLEKRRGILSALYPRGGFDLCEMVIAANAAGLGPDTPLLHDYILRTPEIPRALCAKKDGGLLSREGVVDVITNLRKTDEAGLGGGVFVVVRSDNPYAQNILVTKGCLSNSGHTTALIYRPYHLCGAESPTTLLCMGLGGIGTGSRSFRQSFDIVQSAAQDLKAGEVMGNDHDPRLLTSIVPASPISGGGPIPAHLLSGRRLLRDCKKGTVIEYGMVEQPRESTLWDLRRKQDAMTAQGV